MSAGSEGGGAIPDRTPPFGTGQHIRTRAIWAVSLFTAAIPPAVVGLGIATATDDQVNVALPLALPLLSVSLFLSIALVVPLLR